MTSKKMSGRTLMIGDLHFGERGNSRGYNEQLLTFIEWCGEVVREHQVTRIVQMGDYFHHRNKIQVETLDFGITGARRLASFGVPVYVLSGNHDLFYLDRLDVTSLSAISPYVTVVDEITVTDDGLVLAPWIATGEMWDELINEYAAADQCCLGHFELNGFMVNEKYVMENGYSPVALRAFRKVYSGHYHSWQEKDNVEYLGTPLPITMNEANEEHGVKILDSGSGEEIWLPYTAVQVRSIPYRELEAFLEDERLDPAATSIRIEFPDDLEDETLLTSVQEELEERGFSQVKVKYRGKKAAELVETEIEGVEGVENIDAAVVAFIDQATESVSGVEKARLKRWYTEAIERSRETAGD